MYKRFYVRRHAIYV